jgi:hypothetical protein
LRYDPRTTSSQTTTIATGTERYFETPNSSIEAATPANSAIVVATLLTSRSPIARKVSRKPNCSRMSAANPLPVTAPVRAAISCTTTSETVMMSRSQSVW